MTTTEERDQPTRVDDAFAQALLELINDELSLDPDTPVEMNTDLVMTGQVDSLGVMEIVEWIEDRLDAEIDPTDIIREHFETVDRMVDFARQLTA